MLIDHRGEAVGPQSLRLPSDHALLAAYAGLVTARRLNEQASALARQGRLAVYPSSEGQEACQVAAAQTLDAGDWLFPTYRDTAAVILRGVDPLEALSLLLPALPATLRAAVFIVLHQPRERPSRLAALFQGKCALPVREAEDKEPVAPGTVYLAPPDYHLLLDQGPCLALSADEPVNYSRPAIDVLFESAADLYRERLLGIPGAEVEQWSGREHFVHLAEPDRFVQRLLTFVHHCQVTGKPALIGVVGR